MQRPIELCEIQYVIILPTNITGNLQEGKFGRFLIHSEQIAFHQNLQVKYPVLLKYDAITGQTVKNSSSQQTHYKLSVPSRARWPQPRQSPFFRPNQHPFLLTMIFLSLSFAILSITQAQTVSSRIPRWFSDWIIEVSWRSVGQFWDRRDFVSRLVYDGVRLRGICYFLHRWRLYNSFCSYFGDKLTMWGVVGLNRKFLKGWISQVSSQIELKKSYGMDGFYLSGLADTSCKNREVTDQQSLIWSRFPLSSSLNLATVAVQASSPIRALKLTKLINPFANDLKSTLPLTILVYCPNKSVTKSCVGSNLVILASSTK